MSPIRVGVIGASPDRGWAASAHLPALKALPQFDLAAVCTTKQHSADATAKHFDIPMAFADWRMLVARPDIDLIVITTKVRFHRELVLGALAAGKHVFCEWPLGRDSAEAAEMLAAAQSAGVQHMVGLQGRAHPTLNHARDLLRGGHVGEVISCTLVSSLASWGPRLPVSEAYRADRAGGATGLTIPGGHSLDTLCHILGPFQSASALVTTQHKTTEIIGDWRDRRSHGVRSGFGDGPAAQWRGGQRSYQGRYGCAGGRSIGNQWHRWRPDTAVTDGAGAGPRWHSTG